MERNTVTTIDALRLGDRFYKATDKKKTVWTVVEQKAKVTKYQTYAFFAKKDGALYPDPIQRTTQLIFLRHTI